MNKIDDSKKLEQYYNQAKQLFFTGNFTYSKKFNKAYIDRKAKLKAKLNPGHENESYV